MWLRCAIEWISRTLQTLNIIIIISMASFELEKLQTATIYSIYYTRIVDTCDMMRAIFNFNEVSRGLREISRCAVSQFCKRAWGKVFDKSLIFTYRSIYSPGFVSNCSRLRIMWANCEFKFNSLLLFLPRWSRTNKLSVQHSRQAQERVHLMQCSAHIVDSSSD